jgi:DNA-binding CsgD family transcriptional regulator
MGAQADSVLDDLTPRELSVLELIAEGMSNEGIATRLSLNTKTIEGTIRVVFIKLGLFETSTSENRRVKAAVRYLESTSPRPRGYGRQARDLQQLMLSAPFDTLSALLERRAGEASEQGWVLRASAAWFATISEDFDRAGRLARVARDLAIDSPTGRVITAALVATLDAFQGLAPLDHRRLDELFDVVMEPNSPSPDVSHLCALLEVPNWFTFADRMGDASLILDRYIDTEHLDATARISMLGCVVELDLRRGRWQHTAARLAEISELSEAIGASSGYADSLAARLAAMRGDIDHVQRSLAASRAAGIERSDLSTMWRADAAECLAHLGVGQYVAAQRLADALRAAATRSGLRLPSVRLWDLDQLIAFADEPAAGADLLSELRRDVELTESRFGRAVVLVGEGLASTSERSVDLLRAAAAAFEELGWPFERARSLLLIAERLANIDPVASIDAAQSAVTMFDALQATTWSDRCRLLVP